MCQNVSTLLVGHARRHLAYETSQGTSNTPSSYLIHLKDCWSLHTTRLKSENCVDWSFNPFNKYTIVFTPAEPCATDISRRMWVWSTSAQLLKAHSNKSASKCGWLARNAGLGWASHGPLILDVHGRALCDGQPTQLQRHSAMPLSAKSAAADVSQSVMSDGRGVQIDAAAIKISHKRHASAAYRVERQTSISYRSIRRPCGDIRRLTAPY